MKHLLPALNKNYLCIASAILLLSYVSPLNATADPKSQQAEDSVTIQADAVAIPGFNGRAFSLSDTIDWPKTFDGLRIQDLANAKVLDLSQLSCLKSTVDKSQAYVFHLARWSGDDTPQLISSTWSAYNATGNDKLRRRLTSTGDPFIFNKRQILFIGINVFQKPASNRLTISYKTSVTQGTPANVQALGQLVTALIGLSTNVKAIPQDNLVAFACQAGTEHLPFDFNVVENIGIPKPSKPTDSTGSSPQGGSPGEPVKPQPNLPNPTPSSQDPSPRPNSSVSPENAPIGPNDTIAYYISLAADEPNDSIFEDDKHLQSTDPTSPQTTQESSQADSGKQSNQQGTASKSSPTSGQADCTALSTKDSCTISRKLTSLDAEWWDISLGMSVPGVKETKYSIANSMLTAKPTTHADVYALFDIDPAGYFWTKNTPIPHAAVGLPVAGQTLHRPFVGVSENFTGWSHLERLGFPVHMNVFVGGVFMKTTIVTGSPTNAAELSKDSSSKRVTKWLFGVEVPVSSLISKVGKGNKATSTNSKSSSSTDNAGSKSGSTSQ